MNSPATISSGVSMCSDFGADTGKLSPDDRPDAQECSTCHETPSKGTPTGTGCGSQRAQLNQTSYERDLKVVDMGHSDVDLQVNDTVFKTHMHILADFARLGQMIESNPTTGSRLIRLHPHKQGSEDVANTFKILYASLVRGPFDFDPPVYISALRMSTVYDYPDLRAYSIKHLEQAKLDPIQRIQLVREFNLASWEGAAYEELYQRDKGLTDEEAGVLGLIDLAKIARVREAKLRREKAEIERECKGDLERALAEKEQSERKGKAQKDMDEQARKSSEARILEMETKLKEEMVKRQAEEKARKDARGRADIMSKMIEKIEKRLGGDIGKWVAEEGAKLEPEEKLRKRRNRTI